MKGVNIYKPLGRTAPVAQFIDSLDPKLRDKLIRWLIELPNTPKANMKEPHFKHFALERYRDLYELRARGKVMVRIIFTIWPNGDIEAWTRYPESVPYTGGSVNAWGN